MWLMSDAALLTALRAGVPTLAIIAGIVIDGLQLKAFRAHMDTRFDQLRRRIDADVLKHLEER
jgi:hypothetical protein